MTPGQPEPLHTGMSINRHGGLMIPYGCPAPHQIPPFPACGEPPAAPSYSQLLRIASYSGALSDQLPTVGKRQGEHGTATANIRLHFKALPSLDAHLRRAVLGNLEPCRNGPRLRDLMKRVLSPSGLLFPERIVEIRFRFETFASAGRTAFARGRRPRRARRKNRKFHSTTRAYRPCKSLTSNNFYPSFACSYFFPHFASN